MSSTDNGLLACGALLGITLVALSNHTRPSATQMDKNYKKYSKSLRSNEVFNDKELPTFLGIEIANVCSCGNKVKKHQEQRLMMNETGDKWYRLCSYCIHNP